MDRQRVVILMHASGAPADLQRQLRDDPESQWIYFGRDVRCFREWMESMKGRGRRLDIGASIQEAAASLRTPFLNLLAEIGQGYSADGSTLGFAWWTSRLSERNTMVSPLFLHCCYLKIALESIRSAPGTLCVIAESPALLETIAGHCSESGWSVRRYKGRNERLGGLLFPLRVLLGFAFLTYRSFRDWFCARLTWRLRLHPVPPAGNPVALIHTYADEASLSISGIFADRYFADLEKWLSAVGFDVFTAPTLTKMRRSRLSAFAWFRGKGQFLFPADFCHLSDYWQLAVNGWRQLFLLNRDMVMAGLDIARLAREEMQRQVFAGDMLDAIYYYFPHRLAQKGWRPTTAIYTFENQVAEKAFNLGLRTYLPQAQTVGYQHSALYPLRLCNAITKLESEMAPLPDRIICSGPFFRDYLAKEEFPRERLVVGCALRYQHLFNLSGSTVSSYIGVPLPLAPRAAGELLWKVLISLNKLGEERVVIKAHPMSSMENSLAAIGLKNLPDGFFSTDEPMPQFLGRAKMLLSCCSSTLIEALAAGKPVIAVGSDFDLDINPVAWWPDLCPVLRHPDEIRAYALRLLNRRADEAAEYKRRAVEILHSCFAPVSQEGIKVFVEETIPVSDRCYASS